MKEEPDSTFTFRPNPNHSSFLKEIAAKARSVLSSHEPSKDFDAFYETQKDRAFLSLQEEIEEREKAIEKLRRQFLASRKRSE